ncbi:MAG: archease [Candidatus Anstonellaceae archaeon]
MPYRFLEHSADIKIQARGKNFLAALKQLFLAYREFVTSKKNFRIKKDSLKKILIKEKGENKEELVFNFFVALIAESDIRKQTPLYLDIKRYKKNPYLIVAEVYLTDKIKQKDQLKAVTYHELEVKREKEWTTITIIFDV